MVAGTVVLVLALLFNIALCVSAIMEDHYLTRMEDEEEEP